MFDNNVDRSFIPGPVRVEQAHIPTLGPTLKDRLLKLINLIRLKVKDIFAANFNRKDIDDPAEKLVLNATLRKHSMMMSNIIFSKFTEFLKNKQIKGIHIVPLERAESDMRPLDEISPSQILKNKDQEIVAYPFVYPTSGCFSYPHVVLIVVDSKNKTIYYYDPQGLTSDDPERKKSLPHFLMRNDLEYLALQMFQNEGKVVENIAKHQSDPVNCGTFVMKALYELHNGKTVEQALTFDPNQDITAVRRQMGEAYLTFLRPIK